MQKDQRGDDQEKQDRQNGRCVEIFHAAFLSGRGVSRSCRRQRPQSIAGEGQFGREGPTDGATRARPALPMGYLGAAAFFRGVVSLVAAALMASSRLLASLA